MFKHIDKVRQMPITKRKVVAFTLTVIITFLIGSVWFLVWFPGFKQELNLEDKRKWGTPTENISDDFKKAFQDIKSTINRVKDIDVSGMVEYYGTTTQVVSSSTPKIDYNISTTT